MDKPLKIEFDRMISPIFSHHLKLYLDAQGLLLHSSYPCGECLSHAGGPAQGQLGNSFKTGDRTGQNGGSSRSACAQRADDLPERDTVPQSKVQNPPRERFQ